MSQITRCPSCATSFKVVPDQLRISEGWVRCGHCEHVFDATEHLQPLPTAVAPATPDTHSSTQDDALPAALPTAPAAPVAPPDPWEIPLPPPPPAPSPEDLAPVPPEVLDFASPEAAPAASNIDLDWPEAAPPPPPVTAPTPAQPPAPTPAPPAPTPTPIPAASIPTDIDWPEPALELEADAAAEAEQARTAEAEANASPVMPELDLAPILAPLPTPTPEAKEVFSAPTSALTSAPSLSLDERIEPSGPLDWAQDTPPAATLLPAAALAATAPPQLAPDTTAPPTAATPARKGKNKNKPPAPAAADTAPTPTLAPPAETSDTHPSPDEPSFVRAARRKALWRKPLVRLGLALLAIVLLLSLIGQVLVHDRHRLAASQPSWRPMLELLCAPLNCTVGLYRQIGAVVVESSSFNRVDGGVYHFAVTLKNRSGLMLEMPAVELTLTDANEQPVLRRVFMPQELGAGTTLAAHAEWSSTVLVRIATGNTPMAGYRVLAFYP